eukprot:6095436-Pyramimonas_sp.AAC.2
MVPEVERSPTYRTNLCTGSVDSSDAVTLRAPPDVLGGNFNSLQFLVGKLCAKRARILFTVDNKKSHKVLGCGRPKLIECYLELGVNVHVTGVDVSGVAHREVGVRKALVASWHGWWDTSLQK